jgi:hypothetical protein
MGGRLPGQLGPQQPSQAMQPPKGMGGPGSMLPPGQASMNGPPKKESEGDMNLVGSAPTPGALLNNAQSNVHRLRLLPHRRHKLCRCRTSRLT